MNYVCVHTHACPHTTSPLKTIHVYPPSCVASAALQIGDDAGVELIGTELEQPEGALAGLSAVRPVLPARHRNSLLLQCSCCCLLALIGCGCGGGGGRVYM